MNDAILVINAGSSSIKFSAYAVVLDTLDCVFRGQVERINTQPHFVIRDGNGEVLADDRWDRDPSRGGHEQAFAHLREWLASQVHELSLVAVGHRVVHGGVDLCVPTLIDDDVLQMLESLVPLAPLHQPHNLSAIKAVMGANPELPQVACFDTAFHRDHPKVADRFGLPPEYYDAGIRRFGFHGLSYEYITKTLPTIAPTVADGRLVVAHLGSGASMCAIKNGHSIDSTLSFTALDGLPMGTRCGDLDPGVVIYLLREGMSLDEIEELLYKRSGLLGISGESNDMRRLLASENAEAAEAIDYFVYRIVRELGGLCSVLGGLDALVFTAGIGANSPEIRAAVCRRAAWLGIEIDEAANLAGNGQISTPGVTPSVWAIQTDEERMIALHTRQLIRQVNPSNAP
ncbi:MAG: acetate/propionate family kinase [Planctomycetota bacterium]